MNEQVEKPLISFVLIAYNQERFIRQAVEGAFGQTYSPLEVILSDDFSSDDTFRIMEQMARAYRGQHRVILNRNKANLGIGGHLSAALALASGELAVMAAGDDVSLGHRTNSVHQGWLNSGKRAFVITSSAHVISSDGVKVGELTCKRWEIRLGRTFGVIGPTYALNSQVWKRFSKLDGVYNEDTVLSLRALMLGSILAIDEPLVNYRVHGNSASIRFDQPESYLEEVDRKLLATARRLSTVRRHLADVCEARQWIKPSKHVELVRLRLENEGNALTAILKHREIQKQLLSLGIFSHLAAIIRPTCQCTRRLILLWAIRRVLWRFTRSRTTMGAHNVPGCGVAPDASCPELSDLESIESARENAALQANYKRRS